MSNNTDELGRQDLIANACAAEAILAGAPTYTVERLVASDYERLRVTYARAMVAFDIAGQMAVAPGRLTPAYLRALAVSVVQDAIHAGVQTYTEAVYAGKVAEEIGTSRLAQLCEWMMCEGLGWVHDWLQADYWAKLAPREAPDAR